MARGSVRQRGTTWTVVFDESRADGRRRQRSKGGFRTRKDAERYLREQLVSLDAGTYMAPRKLTVATYLAEHWLPTMQARGLRPSTLERYESHVRCAITPVLGGLPLQGLMPTHLNRLYGDLRTAGRAPKTIRNIHGVLSKALADAERWGLVGATRRVLPTCPQSPARSCGSGHPNRPGHSWPRSPTTGSSPPGYSPLPPACAAASCSAFAGRTSTSMPASCASPGRGCGPGTRWWPVSRRRPVVGAPSHSTRPPWRRCVSTASARPKSGWPRARTMPTAAWPSPCRAARHPPE